MSVQGKLDYESLLDRLQNKMGNVIRKEVSRLEVPTPKIMWVGKN